MSIAATLGKGGQNSHLMPDLLRSTDKLTLQSKTRNPISAASVPRGEGQAAPEQGMSHPTEWPWPASPGWPAVWPPRMQGADQGSWHLRCWHRAEKPHLKGCLQVGFGSQESLFVCGSHLTCRISPVCCWKTAGLNASVVLPSMAQVCIPRAPDKSWYWAGGGVEECRLRAL